MLFKFRLNKIYHIASMARSGETLMLKILAVHPEIKIVHDLEKGDDINKEKAFRFLQTYKRDRISRNHSIIKPYNLKRNQNLILKQGVWRHSYPFKGFVLTRNPASIYASLKAYDKDLKEYHEKDNFWFENEKRILRWLNDIEKESIPLLIDKTPVEQFCFFYNIRMKQLLETNLPVVRYEDLILKTEDTLKNICKILNIEMTKNLLNAHKNYNLGEIGHGKIDLSRKIDRSSLDKYKTIITQKEFETIMNTTKNIYTKFKYKLNNNEVFIN